MKDIQVLGVKCVNTDEGCKWEGTVATLMKHLHTECLHAMAACKYRGIGCGVEVKRRDMAEHERNDAHHLHMAVDTVSSLQARLGTLRGSDSMTFALSDYQARKEGNVRFTSPSFYTNPNGYHMALVVYPNGANVGKDKYLSVFSALIEGKYDDRLQWPFIGIVVKVVLLNQLEDKNHHSATIALNADDQQHVLKDSSSNKWGIMLFLPHSELEHNPAKKTHFLVDDTLYFRVTVEVVDTKSWLECTA